MGIQKLLAANIFGYEKRSFVGLTEGQRLVGAGQYGISLPLDERADLVMRGRDRLAGEDREQYEMRQALRAATAAGGASLAATAVPALARGILNRVHARQQRNRHEYLGNQLATVIDQVSPEMAAAQGVPPDVPRSRLLQDLERSISGRTNMPFSFTREVFEDEDATKILAQDFRRALDGPLRAIGGSREAAANQLGEAVEDVFGRVNPELGGDFPIEGGTSHGRLARATASLKPETEQAYLRVFNLTTEPPSEAATRRAKQKVDRAARLFSRPLIGKNKPTDTIFKRLIRPRYRHGIALGVGLAAGGLARIGAKRRIDEAEARDLEATKAELMERDLAAAMRMGEKTDPTLLSTKAKKNIGAGVSAVAGQADTIADVLSLADLLAPI